jgi:hypothetical protein
MVIADASLPEIGVSESIVRELDEMPFGLFDWSDGFDPDGTGCSPGGIGYGSC